MPREHLSAGDRAKFMAEVLSDITQVQYVHPSNATTSHIAPVDASPRFIAVPPVTGTNGPRSNSSNVIVRPTSLSILRQNNPFYLRFDAVADSRYGGYVPNDVLINYPIHPSVNTISFTAVNGTDQLIANWNHGD